MPGRLTSCLHKHEDEYMAHSSSPSRSTNLQHVVGTGDVWVSLDVEGFQEVQDDSVALWQMDSVLTPAHGRVRARVVRAGQNPRG